MTRRIEVEVERLIVDSQALARPRDRAAAIEAELGAGPGRRADLGTRRDPALGEVGAAVAASIRKAMRMGTGLPTS